MRDAASASGDDRQGGPSDAIGIGGFPAIAKTPRRVAAAIAALGAALIAFWVAVESIGARDRAGLALAIAGSLSLVAAVLALFRAPLPARARLRRAIRERKRRIVEASKRLAAAQSAFLIEVAQSNERLVTRERRLDERFAALHEWMEFPIAPSDSEWRGGDGGGSSGGPADDHRRTAELAEKDRRLLALLEEETRVLFQKIRDNAYVRDGRFRPESLRDDAWRLVANVAALYAPGSDEPWLAASLGDILRSASRICLQSLVVLDHLPLNAKELPLAELHRAARQAVSAYGLYKATEPYLPFVNAAYYAGRIALGANPVSMGAWWFVGRGGARLAREAGTRFVHRQILAYLRDMVRVVGFEAARAFGGDFPHRDAHWIFGMELTELVRQVPLSPTAFAGALQEVGSLPLRVEYDRIFLYRCLAAGRSAGPQRYAATDFLTPDERRSIARRLEAFLAAFRVREADRAFEPWARGVEERLDIRLRREPRSAIPITDQYASAGRSLAGYLLETKQREPDDVPGLLADTRTLGALEPPRRGELLASIAVDPPFFFEHPDIDPNGPASDLFLDDLVRLAVRVPPHLGELDLPLANAALYLRRDPDAVRRKVDDMSRARFLDLCDTAPPLGTRLTPAAVRAALDLVAPGERIRFIYGRLKLERAGAVEADRGVYWLLGVADRMVVFALRDDRPALVWSNEVAAETERVDSWLGPACRLRGGAWHEESDDARPAWIIPGLPFHRFHDFFAPILAAHTSRPSP